MINEYTEQEMRDNNIDKTNTVKVQGDSYASLHWEKDSWVGSRRFPGKEVFSVRQRRYSEKKKINAYKLRKWGFDLFFCFVFGLCGIGLAKSSFILSY